jgi:hypothetical protein
MAKGGNDTTGPVGSFWKTHGIVGLVAPVATILAALIGAAALLYHNQAGPRPVAPGPTTATTSTTNRTASPGTTTSGVPELPSAYLGTWLGTITPAQSSGTPNSTSLKVMFTGGKVGEPIGTATMGPSIGCPSPPAADMTLEAVTSDSVSVTFASGATNCFVSQGTTTVRIVDSQQEWDLFLMVGEWRGRLSKTG